MKLSEYIQDEERKWGLTKEKIGKIFDEYDEDKYGFLAKGDIASLIKLSFRRN